MIRYVNVDELLNALNSQELAEWLDEQDEYTPASIVEHALKTLPTVDAVPVSFIESEIKRMEDGIEHALIKYKHADGTVERMIARKASLEFTLAKWMAEREEE